MNTLSYQYPYQGQSPYGNSQMYGTVLNPMDNRYTNNQYANQPPTPPTYNMVPPVLAQQTNYIKCRPVASIDEARASQIDLDGSLNVFTDIGNKKIYTKQINLDGTASLNTYCLSQEEDKNIQEYVTKYEFESVIKELQNLIIALQNQIPPVQEEHPVTNKVMNF